MNAEQKLSALRQIMREHNLDAWIIPPADPHLSEYLPKHWQERVYFSSFTGPVGTLIVTADRAGLWAGNRYWEQTAHQLQGSGIELQKVGEVTPYTDWLTAGLSDDTSAGTAASMLSLTARRQLETVFAVENVRLDISRDIADVVWTDRPALPQETIFPHNTAFVSETTAAKLTHVCTTMKEQGVAWHLISSLDDTAWLTNLRGSDVPYDPVFLPHLLIGTDSAVSFIGEAKLNPALRALLTETGITTAPHATMREALGKVPDGLLVDPDKTAIDTLQLMPFENRLIEDISPPTLFKSVKSVADLDHVRETMRQGGAALCGFFAEFGRNLANGTAMNELGIDTMLRKYRSVRPNFVSLSFNTIASRNTNGTLPHYTAAPEAFSDITGSDLLLIDSGVQCLGGTTNITRTIPVDETTPEQKRDYTLVLKVHIALTETVFPESIGSILLDAIYRKPLWQERYNYGHGTGHGVGYFPNVHEGPQIISYLIPINPSQTMKAGMITSGEPGLYRPGKWDIRIKSLITNLPMASPQKTEFGELLHFEALTLCPIDARPMDFGLLTKAEIHWLNAYHTDVRRKLLPLVDSATRD